MPPVSKAPEINITVRDGAHLSSHRHSKRFDVNPIHYATLPLQKSWNTVGPTFERYSEESEDEFEMEDEEQFVEEAEEGVEDPIEEMEGKDI